ncbi:tudor domain-containing protein 15 [Diretmus argenteus]
MSLVRCPDSGPSAPCALWPVDLKLTHLNWDPEAALIHFQGQYLTICELDYIILQTEIQNRPKRKAAVDIGEFCLVEDVTSACWYRGRVQKRREDLFDVFLIDHGHVLSVDIAHVSLCSNDLFSLPPKIVCGFLANVLLLQDCCSSAVEQYFSTLIGQNVTGCIQALLPHKVLIVEAIDINNNLIKLGFGRRMDTDTFLLLVEMLTDEALKQNIKPVPDLLIEKPRGQEFSFKPSSLSGYEDIIAFCGPRLRVGTRVKVRVTAAVNPRLFYCQMTSMEMELRAMSAQLATACESRSKDPRQEPPENLGLFCSVKRGKDEKWYRGFLQFLPINSQVRVRYVDYGFCESVKVENVQRLPPDFLSTPIMAFPCSLSSMTDQDEAVKTQQLSFLQRGLLGGVLDAEICSFDEEQNLYSITVVHADDNSHMKEPNPIQELPKIKIETALEQMPPEGGYFYYKAVMAEALGKSLQTEEVQVDSVFVGYVEHVLNPNHFWIRTQKRNHDFEVMMEEMLDHFRQVKLDEDVLENPELGTLCCAMYEKDMHFYRAVVVDTLKHGAEVLFIDFGNIEKVPHMLIKKIPERFASEPPFALCCTLLNVIPVLVDVWTTANSAFFRQAVSNRALRVHAVHLRKDTFVVDLYPMGSDDDQSITELLISSNQADYLSHIPSETVKQKTKEVTKKRTRLRHSLTSHKSLGGEDCRQNKEGATEIQTEALRDEDTQRDEIVKAQAPTFKTFSFKPGCEVAVRCSHINSPSDFWCQLTNTIPALEELMEKIQQYYRSHTVPIQLGVSCCVAKSPEDGRWYRACITGAQKHLVNVMLVDYGITVQIKEEHNLQTILPEYVELEGQAFRCSLYNLIEPADPESTEVCNSLKEFVRNNSVSLKCSVSHLMLKNNDLACNVVDLYNPQTQQSITHLLVEQGLAREVNVSTKLPSSICPDSFIYSSFNLRSGSEEQVYVTHVSSPWEVYCQLDKNNEIIEELEKKVSVVSEEMMQADTSAVVGKLCLAKYLDGKWYRGLAHPVPSPLHLAVFFVDYGNETISEKINVLFIPWDSAELLFTPMQAVRCRLAQVPKEELYAEVKQWLYETIINKNVRAVVVGKSEDGSIEIELFDGDVHINEKVKELILSLTPKPKTVVSVHVDDTKTKHKQTPIKRHNFGRRTSSNPPKSNARGCSHVQNVGFKSKANAMRCVPKKPQTGRKEKQPEHHNQIHPKSEQLPKLSSLPDNKVNAGFSAQCYISHIDSMKSFFLQMQEDEPSILKMCHDLNPGLCRDSLTKTNPVALRINDLVLAEYEEDGALYRAVVKGYEGSARFKVEFVDYGNSAVMAREKIYPITREYLSQPRFSIPCSLLDTSTYETDASFTDAVMEKPLMVKFVSRFGTHWEVKIEILDGETASPVLNEATAETGNVTEKGREATASPTSSSEMTQRPIMIKRETNQTGAGSEPVVVVTKKRTRTRYRIRTRSKYTDDIQKRHSKSPPSSVKATSDSVAIVMPPVIQAGAKEYATVVSVLHNGHFYTRLHKTTDLFAVVEHLIVQNLYKCTVVAEEDVKEGLGCLARVHGGSRWHRAVVQHVDRGKCHVLCVDHGITEETTIGSLRGLCHDLTTIPSLAVQCKCVTFLSATEEDFQKWYREAVRLLGTEVQLVFGSYNQADNLWMVEIPYTPRSPNAAEELTPPPVGSQNVTVTAQGEPSLNTSPPQRLFFAPIHMDKVYFGFAAAVTTPFEFCVTLESSLPVMITVSVMLDDLYGEMLPLPKAHLIQGSCCLWESDMKKKLCRAEILHTDDAVVVNLVDYGYHMEMAYKECSKLKRLPEELARLPKVTYPCILRGVKPVQAEGQWTEEAAVFFQQCLYQKNLQIFFREFISGTHWSAEVSADSVDVAKLLVSGTTSPVRKTTARTKLMESLMGSQTQGRGEEAAQDC